MPESPEIIALQQKERCTVRRRTPQGNIAKNFYI
jgi:hypothetical protein